MQQVNRSLLRRARMLRGGSGQRLGPSRGSRPGLLGYIARRVGELPGSFVAASVSQPVQTIKVPRLLPRSRRPT
jgi:hypothetical protein